MIVIIVTIDPSRIDIRLYLCTLYVTMNL